MTDEASKDATMTHWLFGSAVYWLIAGAGLIWNLFGMMIYVSTVTATPEQMAQQYNEVEIAFMNSVPVWATSANAIAVTAGVLACVLLLMKRALALPLFIVSLVALLIQDLHAFVLEDVVAAFGMLPAYIQGTVLAIAIGLLFYTCAAKNRGLLS
jgi:hypothetical protein